MNQRFDADRGTPQQRRTPSRRTVARALAGFSLVSVLATVALLAITMMRAPGSGTVDPMPPAGFDLRAEARDLEPAPSAEGPDTPAPTTTSTTIPAPPSADSPDPAQEPQAVAEEIDAGAPAGPSVPVTSGRLEDVEERSSGPAPTRLLIPSLDIDAEIIPVGYREGEMDVPPSAELVAWYEYGPSPGEEGSAVLAGHVAWDRRQGVFWDLRDLPAGAEFEVRFDDGSARWFRAVTLTSFGKSELPSDEIFRRSGDPILTLITCGGAFNPSIGRYEDNVVAYAVEIKRPVE
jgi:sortase (surface protein transpeptidase)